MNDTPTKAAADTQFTAMQPPALVGQPVIITGMHRSGTSLLASLLQSAGVHVGETLLDADAGNRHGYYEDINMLEFHRRVLAALGKDQNGLVAEACVMPEAFVSEARELMERRRPPLWGWKEPRTTLFLKFWAALLPAAKFVFAVRAPWDVVDSLFRRGTDEAIFARPPLAAEVWQHYNTAILHFWQQFPDRCVVVDTSQLQADPVAAINRIGQRLGLPLRPPGSSIFHPASLRSVGGGFFQEMLTRYHPRAAALYDELLAAAGAAAPLPQTGNRSAGEQVMRQWLELRTMESGNVQGAVWLNRSGGAPTDVILRNAQLQQEVQALLQELHHARRQRAASNAHLEVAARAIALAMQPETEDQRNGKNGLAFENRAKNDARMLDG